MEKSKVRVGALYGRVSVDEAAEKEHGSLEAQEYLGMEFVKTLTARTGIEHKIKYTLIEEKGASGKDTNRPEYQKLLSLIRTRKIDFVTAKEISRLSRSTLDFATLTQLCRENGVAIYIRGLDLDPSSPMGEMLFKLLAVLAEFERKMIVSRVTENARARMLKLGHSNGGRTPLGFDRHPEKKGFWIANTEEMKKVEHIFRIFVESGSLKATLDEIKHLGIKSKYSSNFTHHTLAILLRNTAYIGKRTVTHGLNNELQTVVDLPHGCVLSVDLFERAQRRLEEIKSSRKSWTINSARVYLLSGILEHQDGSNFCGQSATSRNGSKRFYYWSKKHKVRIDADLLEAHIGKFLRNSFQDDKELASVIGQVERNKTTRLDILRSRIKDIRSEIQKQEAAEAALVSQLQGQSSGDASKVLSWLEGQVSKIEKQKRTFLEELAELEKEKAFLETQEIDRNKSRSILGGVFGLIEKSDPVRKREFYRQVFKRIQFSKDCQVLIEWRLPEAFTAKGVPEVNWRPQGDSNPCILREREVS